MPAIKKSKKSIVKSTARKLTQASLEAKNASLEAQVEQLQAHLAALTGGNPLLHSDQNSVPRAVGSDPFSAANSDPWSVGSDQSSDPYSAADSSLPTAHGPQTAAKRRAALTRQTFPVPVVTRAFASGPHAITVNWLPVPGADGYSLRFATDPELTHYVSSTVAATINGMTRVDLLPNTKYYVMIRANAASPDTASNYSVPIEVTTPAESLPGVVGDLDAWWNALEDVRQLFFKGPLDFGNFNLTPAERRSALGSGVRRYGYIDKTSDMARDYPQYWPVYFDQQDRFKELIREIEVLRKLVVYFETGTRDAIDLLLIAGREAFQIANKYYRSVRDAARDQNSEAASIFRQLRIFWQHRRLTSGEPTEQQAISDAKAIQRGTKKGSVTFVNEGETVSRGKKGVIDETRPAHARDGGKVAVTEKIE